MNNSLVIWFKNLAEGWKIASALIAMVTVISIVAVKIDHWKDKGLDQINVIEHLSQFEKEQKVYNRIKDSIELKRYNDINQNISILITNQKTLTNAVGTIGSRITNTVPELFKLMGGLQFELVQPEAVKSVFGKASIRIVPISKDSIK
jgi:hypothetical protein